MQRAPGKQQPTLHACVLYGPRLTRSPLRRLSRPLLLLLQASSRACARLRPSTAPTLSSTSSGEGGGEAAKWCRVAVLVGLQHAGWQACRVPAAHACLPASPLPASDHGRPHTAPPATSSALPAPPCSNPVNSTVPICAEVLKKAGVYNPRKVRPCVLWQGGGGGGGGIGGLPLLLGWDGPCLTLTPQPSPAQALMHWPHPHTHSIHPPTHPAHPAHRR